MKSLGLGKGAGSGVGSRNSMEHVTDTARRHTDAARDILHASLSPSASVVGADSVEPPSPKPPLPPKGPAALKAIGMTSSRVFARLQSENRRLEEENRRLRLAMGRRDESLPSPKTLPPTAQRKAAAAAARRRVEEKERRDDLRGTEDDEGTPSFSVSMAAARSRAYIRRRWASLPAERRSRLLPPGIPSPVQHPGREVDANGSLLPSLALSVLGHGVVETETEASARAEEAAESRRNNGRQKEELSLWQAREEEGIAPPTLAATVDQQVRSSPGHRQRPRGHFHSPERTWASTGGGNLSLSFGSQRKWQQQQQQQQQRQQQRGDAGSGRRASALAVATLRRDARWGEHKGFRLESEAERGDVGVGAFRRDLLDELAAMRKRNAAALL